MANTNPVRYRAILEMNNPPIPRWLVMIIFPNQIETHRSTLGYRNVSRTSMASCLPGYFCKGRVCISLHTNILDMGLIRPEKPLTST